MEQLKGTVESTELKQGKRSDGKPWYRVAYKIDGNIYAKFFNTLEDTGAFVMGDKVMVEYEIDGKYKNIKGMTKVVALPDDPVTEVETVGCLDSRQKSITLGQGANLALKHMHYLHEQHTEEEFDEHFKKQTKRFYNLLKEMQEGIL